MAITGGSNAGCARARSASNSSERKSSAGSSLGIGSLYLVVWSVDSIDVVWCRVVGGWTDGGKGRDGRTDGRTEGRWIRCCPNEETTHNRSSGAYFLHRNWKSSLSRLRYLAAIT